MHNAIGKPTLLMLPVIFVGILGVVGIYEDISTLQSHEAWDASKIVGKYVAAFLGTVSYAFVQYRARKRVSDDNT